MQQYLCIGTITKPQGIRGEVKILPLTDDINRFVRLKKIFFQNGGDYDEHEVDSARVDDSFAYIKLAGVDDMSAADLLRGKDVFVDRKNAVRLPKGRWFIADLLGCKVQDDAGNEIGVLGDVLQAGGNDVYVVKKGGKTLMFPAIKALLLSVDVENKLIVVDEKRLQEVAVYED